LKRVVIEANQHTGEQMMDPILKATLDLGQSVWLDFISRELMDSGTLKRMLADGIRGMTSNPTIFQHAISKGNDYDRDIEQGIEREETGPQIFEHIAVSDVGRAADLIRPVYDESNGTDGFVSIEVSPGNAYETDATIHEVKRLWDSVQRPNIMVKIPGTEPGLPAIRRMLAEGININITLLFSLEQYREVLEAYLQAMEERIEAGKPVERISSVASFFVSRVDSAVDKELSELKRMDLAGKAAIANACLAYRHFQQVNESDRWKKLAAKGANVQRPLWASTSTKDPSYSDILYVQELIAEHTVNTMPPQTIDAYRDHGQPRKSLLDNLKSADDILREIGKAGVDLDKITSALIEEGVKKFADSYDQVIDAIEEKKRAKMSSRERV
jgi:transaldolase